MVNYSASFCHKDLNEIVGLQMDYEDDDGLPSEYEAEDLYNPAQVFHEPIFFSKIEARQPLKPQPFVVLETPFAKNFRLVVIVFV